MAAPWSAMGEAAGERLSRSLDGYRPERAGFPCAVARALPPELRRQIALSYHRGQPVAGAVVLLAGDIAQYLSGGSDEAMLKLNAGYALQWWLIRAPLCPRPHLGGASVQTRPGRQGRAHCRGQCRLRAFRQRDGTHDRRNDVRSSCRQALLHEAAQRLSTSAFAKISLNLSRPDKSPL
jgi:GNAT acetyltransferase-like protein